MGLIPEEKIAEIRDRTDIVQVIGEYVALKRAGVNHKGLCPFHNERTPSFNVNQQKQFFHCFGCGESGDVFSFLSKIEAKSFVETARELAKRAGVDLPEPERSREAAEARRREDEGRARLLRVNEVAATFFQASLDDRARGYLARRGLGDKARETFRVGYAPPGWDALTRHFEAKKVPHELAERAGLLRRRDRANPPAGAPPSKQTHFDVFVDRVMYALTSPMGEVIGFGGRVLEDVPDQPKYKNSPETLLYKKGENLFGLHVAKHAIRRTGRALVVEGNFDVMTLHEHGLDYAVAPQGTAVTEAQVALLKRFAREVVLMLDADPAGRAATMKVIRLFVEAELPCRIAQLRAQGGKKVDPDDLARNDLARLKQIVDGAVDAVEFFFEQVASTADPTVPGRVKAIEEVGPILRAVREPLARDLYVDRLAQLLKVDAGLIRRTLRGGPQAKPTRAPSPTELAPERPAVRPRALAPAHAKLLSLLAQHATLIAHVTPEAIEGISDQSVRELVLSARAAGAFQAQALLERCAPEIRDAVARAFLSEEFAGVSDQDARALLQEIARKLVLPTDIAALEAERKAAIARNDLARVREITARILSTRVPGPPTHGGGA